MNRTLVPFMMLLAVAGCGSSEPTYYTLKAWPGAPIAGGPATLKIETPSVAATLDRDYIVAADRSYRLKLDGDAAWSEPLADMIGQTLAQDLTQRLPGSSVFTQAGAISTDAQAKLELDVQAFARNADGQVVLDASLSVMPTVTGGFVPPAQVLHLTMPSSGSGTAALVADLSRLLGQVADVAAEQAGEKGRGRQSP